VQLVLGIPEQPALTDETWSKHVSEAKAAGIEAVEIHGQALPKGISQATARGLRVAVIRSAAGRPDCHLASVAPTVRTAAVSRVLSELNQAAGAAVVTVAPAAGRWAENTRPAGTYAEALHATLESLRALARPVECAGEAVAVEAAADGFLLAPMELRELLDLVNQPDICACLDVARIVRISRVEDWIGTLRHRIGCVRWNADDAGDIDGLAAALAEVRYAGPVVCHGDPAWVGRQLSRLERVLGV